MRPLKIYAEWDNDATVWVATSEDVNGLTVEAGTMDELIEKLKSVIPELMERNFKSMANHELPIMFVKSWPVVHYLSCPILGDHQI